MCIRKSVGVCVLAYGWMGALARARVRACVRVCVPTCLLKFCRWFCGEGGVVGELIGSYTIRTNKKAAFSVLEQLKRIANTHLFI